METMRQLMLASAIAALVAAAAPRAQQPVPQAPDPIVPVSFEVAAVKPNKSGDRGGNIRRQPGGRITTVNMPLRQLIAFAYQLLPFQLIGGTGWIANERFDIVSDSSSRPSRGRSRFS